MRPPAHSAAASFASAHDNQHVPPESSLPAPKRSFVEVCGRRLEVETISAVDPGRPTLLFLHEGLGSISTWRDFPSEVATATRCPAVIYSRYGYGNSAVPEASFGVDYMHREALEALPELLAKLGITRPILVGHSDGASISLIYAGARDAVAGLALLAPHVFVEDLSVKSIAEAKIAFETTGLPEKLGRHHADPRKMFYRWNDIWLHPDFRRWNIESFLPQITCPVLAIQGYDDEYGTMAQLDAITVQVAGPCEVVGLADCGHRLHRDQPEKTVEAIARFVRRIADR